MSNYGDIYGEIKVALWEKKLQFPLSPDTPWTYLNWQQQEEETFLELLELQRRTLFGPDSRFPITLFSHYFHSNWWVNFQQELSGIASFSFPAIKGIFCANKRWRVSTRDIRSYQISPSHVVTTTRLKLSAFSTELCLSLSHVLLSSPSNNQQNTKTSHLSPIIIT